MLQDTFTSFCMKYYEIIIFCGLYYYLCRISCSTEPRIPMIKEMHVQLWLAKGPKIEMFTKMNFVANDKQDIHNKCQRKWKRWWFIVIGNIYTVRWPYLFIMERERLYLFKVSLCNCHYHTLMTQFCKALFNPRSSSISASSSRHNKLKYSTIMQGKTTKRYLCFIYYITNIQSPRILYIDDQSCHAARIV